ncbi:MAG: hypothetical protein IPH27_11430 [Actinomycetales bacterium]|jgi:hypothetical protein|nr:hypothetical protein [Candidatus Phosphoribacter baldrii]MBK6956022.1 hypothetical protein [Candidatus Phosphoribacter baldrii]
MSTQPTSETPTTGVPTPTDSEPTPVIVRRRSSGMFIPKPVSQSSQDEVIVARQLFMGRKDARPLNSRSRKIAGDLPTWEPLPPGELLVRRPGS